MRTSASSSLTTIQVSKKTLKKVRAFCRKFNYVGRYWVEDVLEQAVKDGYWVQPPLRRMEQARKGKGSGQSQPLP